MSDTILLVAGGTGGHVFPALALGEVLAARGYNVEAVTDRRAAGYYKNAPFKPNVITSSAIKSGLWGRAWSLFKIGAGIIESLDILRELSPKAVIGFGGYPSFPTLFAAQLLKIPTILHEQNAVFGRANRAVAKKAKQIGLSFANTIHLPENGNTTVTGNPIRAAFRAAEIPYNAPQGDAPFHLLVFGGSQGSRIFNEILPAAFALLSPPLRARLDIVQQVRDEAKTELVRAYDGLGLKARLQGFFDDMPMLHNWSHLTIGRAGASTVAEITNAGRPSILVPLAISLDGDQARNALNLQEKGAAWVLREAELTPQALADRLTELMQQPALLQNAAIAAKTLGMPDAAERLADLVTASIS